MKNKSLPLLLLVVVIVSACVPSVSPTEEQPPAPIPTEESISVPVPTESALQPELSVVTSWRAVRDPRYGFGFAIPCWWLTNPISTDGALYTVKNYDDAYFNANSSKGFWNWPNGTLKLDVIIMEGVDPANSDIDGYLQFSDPTMESLVSVEQQQVGTHTVTIGTFANLNNTNDPNIKLFFFRLSPDKLLMINPIPQNIIETPDFQALLASIVLTQDEMISLPLITPAPALIDTSCAG